MSLVAFVGDSNIEEETRGPVSLMEAADEVGTEVVWKLHLVGIGEVVELVVPEAIDRDGGNGGEISRVRWTDVHITLL